MDEGGRWQEARKAWDDVAERLKEVGRRVGDQYQQLGEQASAKADAGAKGINDAVRDAVDELDRALTSVGDTIRDPRAKESLRKAAASFGEALEATFNEVGEELRRRFGAGTRPSGDQPSGTEAQG